MPVLIPFRGAAFLFGQGDDGVDNPRHELRQPGLRGLQRGHFYAGSRGELPVNAAHALGVWLFPSAHTDVPLGAPGALVGETPLHK